MHLSHSNVGFGNYLQNFMAVSFCAGSSLTQAISPMAAIYMLVTGGIGGINPIALAEATAVMSITLLCVLFVRYVTAVFRIAWLLLLDYQYHIIPLDEEKQSHEGWLQRQTVWINNWTNRSTMSLYCSHKSNCIGYWTYLALRSWPRKLIAMSRCIPAMSTVASTHRRSSCSSWQNVRPATPAMRCET